MAASHKHDSDNTTNERMTHATGQGFERTIPEKHVFGRPAEIAARVGGTFDTLPDRLATNFKQIGPKPAGGNVNNRRPRAYKGDQKFGSPRRYA